MRLTNITRVKRILDIEGTDHDALLNQNISQISKQIEKFLGRHLLKKSRVEQYDIGAHTNMIFLRGYPVESSPAASFVNDTNRTFTGVTALDTSTYYLNLRRGYMEADFTLLYPGPGAMQVTYTGGMAYSLDRLHATISSLVGAPSAGETVTGDTSGATGTVVSAAGTALVCTVDVDGSFEDGEDLTFSGGGTATLDTVDREPILVAYPELAQACEAQVAFMFQRRDAIGVSSVSAEGGNFALDPAFRLLDGVVEAIYSHKSHENRWV